MRTSWHWFSPSGCVTTRERSASLPNVATLEEAGLKGFEVKVWHGIYAPKGTPAPALAWLRDACKALNPHFFRVRAALQKVARAIEAETASMISTAR